VSYSSSEGANAPQLVVVATAATAGPVGTTSRDDGRLESGLVLYANHPNPFDAGTTIRYALPTRMPVRLVIYDIAGRAVRTLVDATEEAGERRVAWDGRNAIGARVRAGLYVCRLEAGGAVFARKMSVMR
jgi:hypothetical protein